MSKSSQGPLCRWRVQAINGYWEKENPFTLGVNPLLGYPIPNTLSQVRKRNIKRATYVRVYIQEIMCKFRNIQELEREL